jgi:hypothetical protein
VSLAAAHLGFAVSFLNIQKDGAYFRWQPEYAARLSREQKK